MFSGSNQNEKKFDIVKAEFDAYKRWGYAVSEPAKSDTSERTLKQNEKDKTSQEK